MIKHYTFLFLLFSFFVSQLSFAQPTAVNDNITVTEDSDIFAQVVNNDDYGPAGPHETNPIYITQFPIHGTALVNFEDLGFIYIEYDPEPDFNGTDSFMYAIKDANGLATTATVIVTVVDDGTDVPTAADDFATTDQDVTVTILVMDNDNPGGDGYGGYITVTGTTQMGGTVVANSVPSPLYTPIDDTITYTPAANYNGVDTFTYTLHDNNGDTSTATVTVLISPGTVTLEVPLAVNDTASTIEDTSVTIDVLQNDSFGSDGPGTTPIITTPAFPEMTSMGGIVSVNDSGTPDNPADDTITYMPNLDISGVDAFTYTITDSNGDTSTATVTVNIYTDEVPEAPHATDDEIVTGYNTAVAISVLENDQVGEFIPLGAVYAGTPSHGTATVDTNGTEDAMDDTIIYTPENGFIGTDVFSYTVMDGFGSDDASVTVHVATTGIIMKSFLDSNGNGTQDSGEGNFTAGQFHYEINNNGTIHDVTASTGNAYIDETNPANTYDLSYSVNSDLSGYYSLSIASYNGVAAMPDGISIYNFAVTPIPFTDLSITMLPMNAPRPGFNHMIMLLVRNNAAVPASGTLTFINDSNVSILGVSLAGTVPNANGFTYDLPNIPGLGWFTMYVIMQVPVIPNIALGDLLTNTVSVAAPDDVDTDNDTSSATQAVVGSYDPNDITESHGEQIVHSEFTSEDYLTYTIRFENTGTANAENIRVESMLDAQLDENSIEMLYASDDYTMERIGSSLVWDFGNVQLPPSEENTQVGHGSLTYRIKPKPGYEIGDVIPNSAEIYFDFNPAIVTNTFNTEFVSTLSVGDIENNTLSLYPNPVKNRLNINSSKPIQNVAVYNLFGQKVLEEKMDAVSGTLDLSGMGSGVYLVRIISAEAENTVRIIKE